MPWRVRGTIVRARVLLGLVFCSLLACGGNTRAPVEDRYARSAPQSQSSTYQVQHGETLYSIAFRYGLDYRKVAAANGISAPYTIYPGQKIYLKEATPTPVPARRAAAPRKSASAAAPVPAPVPVTKPVPAPVSKTTTVARAPSSTVNRGGPTYAGRAVSTWRWPTSGRVIRGYSSSVHKGIDISGKRGDAVVAVAAGKVVYSGTGIVGFGELLIVKHNEIYLSAYGHNERLLVAEGDTVRAGQKIAEKGSSGTDTVKLHFEIRKEGKPVDPQRLLPRR
ncbi:MAG: peptigoglycan-binding protein LysM [Gammaproteobacteria bacterium]|nr:MAG: peptigoglycan-binding protein LysM [Gammaproteobacteria bacterium]